DAELGRFDGRPDKGIAPLQPLLQLLECCFVAAGVRRRIWCLAASPPRVGGYRVSSGQSEFRRPSGLYRGRANLRVNSPAEQFGDSLRMSCPIALGSLARPPRAQPI